MNMWFRIILGCRSRPSRLQDGSQTKPSNPNVDFGMKKLPAGQIWGAILDPKSVSIDAKIDAQIDVEQILKNDATFIHNDR